MTTDCREQIPEGRVPVTGNGYNSDVKSWSPKWPRGQNFDLGLRDLTSALTSNSGATMMIKGSLLSSDSIVRKWAQNLRFMRGKIFNPNNQTPRKSIPTETHHLAQKTVSILVKMRSPEAFKKSPHK